MYQVSSSKFKNRFLLNHKWTFFILVNIAILALLKELYIYVSFLGLLFFSFKNYKKYLPLSIFLLSIMLFLNPFLGSLSSPLWNLVLILFMSFFIMKRKFHLNKLEISYLAILLSFLLTSLINSPYPSIAIIKVVSLSVFSYAVFKTYKWGDINESILRQIIEAIIIANIVLYFTSFGYYINGLFMGIFNHSQSIGIFLIPLLMYYTIAFFEKNIQGKFEKIFSISIILLGIIEMFATYSRTAIFTYIILIMTYFFLNKINIRNFVLIFKKPVRFILMLFIVGVISIQIPQIINKAQEYIFKSYSNDILQSKGTEHVFSTRQVLFDESLKNFKQNPLLGNGFGVQYRNGQLANNEMKYLPLLNIPYTMVNEKGNVYMMVLEEGGLITFSFFLMFLFFQLQITKQYRPAFYPSLSIFIMFNGESTLFSLNGAGAFQFVFLVFLYYLSREKKGVTHEN